jgi:GNAT superfamily N-acetyltransferase
MTGSAGRIGTPEHLTADHDLGPFDSGTPALDDWLKRRALANERAGGSRTYVVCEGKRVIGYYALATGAVAQVSAPGRVRRNMPDPVPVMVLGRLAVDRAYHGRGIGQGLLRDAILRTIQAADIAGIRDPRARDFGRREAVLRAARIHGGAHRSHDVDGDDCRCKEGAGVVMGNTEAERR